MKPAKASTAGATFAPTASPKSPHAFFICCIAPWEVAAIVSFIPPKVSLILLAKKSAFSWAEALSNHAFSSSDRTIPIFSKAP